MKKKLVLLMCGIGVAGVIFGATAAALVKRIQAELRYDIEVVVDGKVQQFKNADGQNVYPVLYNGTTYLPVRAIGELMGKTVYWYEADKRIELVDEKSDSTVTDADVIVPDKIEKQPPVYEKPVIAPKPEITSKDEITEGIAKAKKLALEKAGFKESEVYFLKAELDRDDGVNYYKVEFNRNGIEYEYKYTTDTFKLIEWETDRD